MLYLIFIKINDTFRIKFNKIKNIHYIYEFIYKYNL